jgi:sugar O-acyltransferase (sialic acid O-acetyltransferase NeuD family)
VKNAIVVGGGDLGREVAQYVQDARGNDPTFEHRGFLDDAATEPKGYPDLPVLGTTWDYRISAGDVFVMAISDTAARRAVWDRLSQRGAKWLTLVHPLAYVAPTARVGRGCVICPFAFVGAFAVLDDDVTLNVYASAGHDVRIGEHSVLSPYATLNGHVEIAEDVFLGTHATVTIGRRVGRQARVAAGAVVYQDVPELALASGNPARSRVLYAPPGQTA